MLHVQVLSSVQGTICRVSGNSLENHFSSSVFCEIDYVEMTANSSDSKNIENVLREKSNGKRVLEYFQNDFFFLAEDETQDLYRHSFNFNIVEYQQYLYSVTEDERFGPLFSP